MDVTLEKNATEGSFEVTLGAGDNDFVLVETGQPRDASEAISFSIHYLKAGSAGASDTEDCAEADDTQETPAPTDTADEEPDAKPDPAPTPVPETPESEPSASPAEEVTASPTEAPAAAQRVISLWMTGNDVEALQEGLALQGFRFGRVDGVYGPRTRAAVMRFQRKNLLKVDGLVGEATRAKLAEFGIEIPVYVPPDMTLPEGFTRALSYGMQGKDVYNLQLALIAKGFLKRSPDQAFGRHTRAAVRAFQEASGLRITGVATPETLRFLMAGP